MKFGRFGLAIATALAFGLELGGSALAWDWAPTHAVRGATASGFSVNQDVTVGVSGKILAVHARPTMPTILPYNSAIPIVNILPVVTSGQRPLVIGGAPCTVAIYGADAAGNLYDISSAAWATPPRVVKWKGGTLIPNYTTDTNTILQLGYTINPNSNGQMLGMSFAEIAPPAYRSWAASTVMASGNQIADSNGNIQQVTAIRGNAATGGSQPAWATAFGATTTDGNVTWTLGGSVANPAYNIQVSAAVIMDNPLPNGTWQSWTFNDSVNTVAAGTVVPPADPTYDVLLEIPGNPPYTMDLLNMPAVSLTTAP